LTGSLEAYRAFSDGLAAHAYKPIWITELGMHWGWESMEYPSGCNGRGQGGGEYETAAIAEYMDTSFRWLKDDSSRLNIQNWYFYTSYADIATCRNDNYGGLTLFSSPGEDASLNYEGLNFRDWVFGRRN
jgi:hypothetical protein